MKTISLLGSKLHLAILIVKGPQAGQAPHDLQATTALFGFQRTVSEVTMHAPH